MLTESEIKAYHEDGYLKVEQLFTPEETEELGSEMIRIINEWGEERIGWPGPWRSQFG